MRILHIITRMIVGGAQENTLLSCIGQHTRGHDVILLTGPSLGAEGALMDRQGPVDFRIMQTPHLVRNPHPYHDLAAYYEIRRLCRELKPDVVHTHSSKAGILGRAAAWKEHVPAVIHTIHGPPFHPYQRKIVSKLWISLERFAARRCHHQISVADAMTRQYLAAGIGRPDQYTTVYSGMNVEPFLNPSISREDLRRELKIPADRIVFGTIARLQPLKGHDDILATARDIFAAVPNAHFLWLGNGIFRERFEATIRQNGWQDHFTLTGLLPPTQVPRMIAAMDVVLHPSYREGLARALPQGLLGGKPVISYDCDGAAEVCITGKTGILVPTGNQTALRDAIITLAQSPEREKLGATGREWCMSRFPADVMVEGIQRVYEKVLASKESSARNR